MLDPRLLTDEELINECLRQGGYARELAERHCRYDYQYDLYRILEELETKCREYGLDMNYLPELRRNTEIYIGEGIGIWRFANTVRVNHVEILFTRIVRAARRARFGQALSRLLYRLR